MKFEQSSREHIVGEAHYILAGLIFADEILALQSGNHVGDGEWLIEQLPDERAGAVEAIDGCKVSHFAAHGNDQSFAANHTGNDAAGTD